MRFQRLPDAHTSNGIPTNEPEQNGLTVEAAFCRMPNELCAMVASLAALAPGSLATSGLMSQVERTAGLAKTIPDGGTRGFRTTT